MDFMWNGMEVKVGSGVEVVVFGVMVFDDVAALYRLRPGEAIFFFFFFISSSLLAKVLELYSC